MDELRGPLSCSFPRSNLLARGGTRILLLEEQSMIVHIRYDCRGVFCHLALHDAGEGEGAVRGPLGIIGGSLGFVEPLPLLAPPKECFCKGNATSMDSVLAFLCVSAGNPSM